MRGRIQPFVSPFCNYDAVDSCGQLRAGHWSCASSRIGTSVIQNDWPFSQHTVMPLWQYVQMARHVAIPCPLPNNTTSPLCENNALVRVRGGVVSVFSGAITVLLASRGGGGGYLAAYSNGQHAGLRIRCGQRTIHSYMTSICTAALDFQASVSCCDSFIVS